MKSGSICIIFVLFSLFLSAQENEKSKHYVLGGSVNYTIENNYLPSSSLRHVNIPGTYSSGPADFKYTHRSFSPYIGKEFGQDWLVGIQVISGKSIRRENYENIFPRPDIVHYSRIEDYRQIGIFARYTLLSEKRLNVFIQTFANYNSSGDRTVVNIAIESQLVIKSFHFGSNFGMVYRMTDRGRLLLRTGLFSLVIGSWEDNFNDDEDTFSSLGMNLSLSNLQFGYEWMF